VLEASMQYAVHNLIRQATKTRQRCGASRSEVRHSPIIGLLFIGGGGRFGRRSWMLIRISCAFRICRSPPPCVLVILFDKAGMHDQITAKIHN
jgi:hypothetical protein